MSKIKLFLIVSLFFFPLSSFASTYGNNFLLNQSCTDVHNGSSQTCTQGSDGNLATEYYNNSFPSWIIWDLGAGNEKGIGKWSHNAYFGSGHRYLKNVNISVSNDNSTWYSIATSTQADTGSSYEYNEFILTATTTTYRYYKFTMPDSWATGVDIAEFGAYECLDCGSGTSTASSSIMGFMSEQTDFMLQLLIEAIFVIFGLVAGYLILKRIEKK